MSVSNLLLKNTQNIFQNTSNTSGSRSCNKKGGAGRSVTMSSMKNNSNLNMGRGYSPSVTYTHCNKNAPPRPGQVGGVGYGYTKEGAKFNADVRGLYPVMTKIEKSSKCGGGSKKGSGACNYKYHQNGQLGGKTRKRTRKQKGRGPCGKPLSKCKCKKGGKRRTRTKKRRRRSMCARLTNKACRMKRYKKRCKTTKKRRKGKNGKGRKSHCRSRKNRFSRRPNRKKRRRSPRLKKKMKGGFQYSTSTNYSTPSPQNASGMPWALGPGSFERKSFNCPTSYKH